MYFGVLHDVFFSFVFLRLFFDIFFCTNQLFWLNVELSFECFFGAFWVFFAGCWDGFWDAIGMCLLHFFSTVFSVFFQRVRPHVSA